MILALQVLLDGLLLRCPRCQWGAMFEGFRMYHACPVCALEFERADGEITGGMGVNVAATCIFAAGAAIVLAGLRLPPAIPLLVLVAVGTLFPVLFYRSSRGLWAAILYLTGNNSEPD